jgi:hypothetical protein
MASACCSIRIKFWNPVRPFVPDRRVPAHSFTVRPLQILARESDSLTIRRAGRGFPGPAHGSHNQPVTNLSPVLNRIRLFLIGRLARRIRISSPFSVPAGT